MSAVWAPVRGPWEDRAYRLVEIDSTTYNATRQFAFMGTIRTEVLTPTVTGGLVHFTVKPFNKVGKPTPYTLGRMPPGPRPSGFPQSSRKY